jgi:NAD+--asparagine ADP-ribosyltransferase
MQDFKEEISFGKKIIYWVIGLSFSLSIIGFVIHKTTEATHINDAFQNYEQYQEIYNTCTKLNTDLCNMKSLPENDKMFEQFSKVQRVNTIKTQLNRWVEDYNAKSKMWGRALWKSNQLPYQLTNQEFSCNN